MLRSEEKRKHSKEGKGWSQRNELLTPSPGTLTWYALIKDCTARWSSTSFSAFPGVWARPWLWRNDAFLSNWSARWGSYVWPAFALRKNKSQDWTCVQRRKGENSLPRMNISIKSNSFKLQIVSHCMTVLSTTNSNKRAYSMQDKSSIFSASVTS